MKAAESLFSLYKIFNEFEGPIEAREFVATSVWLILSEIEDEKLPITPEEIEKRLELKASDYISAFKANKKSIA